MAVVRPAGMIKASDRTGSAWARARRYISAGSLILSACGSAQIPPKTPAPKSKQAPAAFLTSEFTPVLFKGLGLPFPEEGKRLPADHNALTQRVDGNTDSNRDGRIDRKDRNGWVEPYELYEEVFSHRAEYRSVIAGLRGAGLEDPFEITPEIRKHVEYLFERYHPETELEKAVLLMQSIIPPAASFNLGERYYSGLSETEGGLEIYYHSSSGVPRRFMYGDLLPQEIMQTPKEKRVAHCLEFSFLQVVFLRSDGIKAHTKSVEPEHVFAVAILDGNKYKIDPANLKFLRSNSSMDTDRQSISDHYYNEAIALRDQNQEVPAIRNFEIAIELDPNFMWSWFNRSFLYYSFRFLPGNSQRALESIDEVLDLQNDFAEAWQLKGLILRAQGKEKEAERCFKKAIRLKVQPGIKSNFLF
jgi:tetratricopeptide (TPR) repeat protein